MNAAGSGAVFILLFCQIQYIRDRIDRGVLFLGANSRARRAEERMDSDGSRIKGAWRIMGDTVDRDEKFLKMAVRPFPLKALNRFFGSFCPDTAGLVRSVIGTASDIECTSL